MDSDGTIQKQVLSGKSDLKTDRYSDCDLFRHCLALQTPRNDSSVTRKRTQSQLFNNPVLGWLSAHGFDDIAVVVLTARIGTDTWQQEMSQPGVSWLQRPFRLDELLDAVRSRERVARNGLIVDDAETPSFPSALSAMD